MDEITRNKLETLALEQLSATSDDDEQWSFLFRTEGAVDFVYCPWSETEDWEFDGEVEGLDLSWAPDRLVRIKRGEIDPDEAELRQWRRAKCHERAAGLDWCRPAWIVPLTVDRKTLGYALFLSNAAPDTVPDLKGFAAANGHGGKSSWRSGADPLEIIFTDSAMSQGSDKEFLAEVSAWVLIRGS